VIEIARDALVLLIGAAGSGKSSFAARHFDAGMVGSSDRWRGVVAGNEADQRATEAAFERLDQWLDARLAMGAVAVVDATNTEWMRRAALIRRARQAGRPVIAIAFDLPLDQCLARNGARRRTVRPAVIQRQHDELRHDLDRLDLEGFDAVHVLHTQDEVDGFSVHIEKGPVTRALSS
jgi:protein phosphatase